MDGRSIIRKCSAFTRHPRVFFSANENVEIVALITEMSPEYRSRILAAADRICAHSFDLLGSGDVDIRQFLPSNSDMKIPWHCDIKSGHSWDPETHYKDITFGDSPGVDVKVPWELSRFQFLTTLGQAYWFTGDDQFTDAFKRLVTDWIIHNPPQRGVNWHTSMDVAIRACNWIVGCHFFLGTGGVDDAFLRDVTNSLYDHGRHVMENLDQRRITHNHYVSNLSGLIYLGVMFPHLDAARTWKSFGITELIREMEKQVYPDGCDFEGSTCYHRLALELFFFPVLLVIINEDDFDGANHVSVGTQIFGRDFIDRLYGMFVAVLYLLKPNGRMPQIGDNDNGRLHTFAHGDILDMRYLLAYGAVFFHDAKFKVEEFGFSPDLLFVFGLKGFEIWNQLEANSLRNIGARAFGDAGWYVIRKDMDYCLVSCGQNGHRGNGGHTHNDKLSFELMIDGHDVVVDPGTFSYTGHPEERKRFRSTRSHNLIVFDSLEQNDFVPNNLFRITNRVEISGVRLVAEKGIIRFEGRIRYLSVEHSRIMEYEIATRRWRIVDRFRSERDMAGHVMFHLAPKINFHDGDFCRGTWKVAAIKVEAYALRRQTYEYSGIYGKKESAIALVVDVGKCGTFQSITTVIDSS